MNICVLCPYYQAYPLSTSMLVDAPWPHGSGANLAVVGTLFEGFGRLVTCPPLPRRLRAMGRAV